MSIYPPGFTGISFFAQDAETNKIRKIDWPGKSFCDLLNRFAAKR